jgi:hypothetical protein
MHANLSTCLSRSVKLTGSVDMSRKEAVALLDVAGSPSNLIQQLRWRCVVIPLYI